MSETLSEWGFLGSAPSIRSGHPDLAQVHWMDAMVRGWTLGEA